MPPPSTEGLRRSVIRTRYRTFALLSVNAPAYYRKLKTEFARLHGLGWKYADISVALDINIRTLGRWRRELGLKARKQPRRGITR